MSNPLMVKPREQTVVLLPGDYQDRLDALAAEVGELEEQAQSDKRKRPAAVKKAEEYDALRDPANIDGAIVVTIREIPSVRWRQLQDDCPPRKGNKRDEIYGFDEDRFGISAVVNSIAAPDGVTEEHVAELSTANFRKLRDAAFEVNEREVAIPKSSAVSVLLRSRAEESKRLPDTE